MKESQSHSKMSRNSILNNILQNVKRKDTNTLISPYYVKILISLLALPRILNTGYVHQFLHQKVFMLIVGWKMKIHFCLAVMYFFSLSVYVNCKEGSEGWGYIFLFGFWYSVLKPCKFVWWNWCVNVILYCGQQNCLFA